MYNENSSVYHCGALSFFYIVKGKTVNPAERIGLLGLGRVAEYSFFHTLLICWAVTIGAMVILGVIGESRLIPFSPKRQFVAFFPGDLFLGLGMASALQVARHLPEGLRWYNAPAMHLVVLVGGIVVAIALTRLEYTGGIYPLRAILSPTKLYHNGVLYVGFGYVAVTTVIACAASGAWRDTPKWTVLTIIGFGVWALLVASDSTVTKTSVSDKASHAHREDWKPLWSSATS